MDFISPARIATQIKDEIGAKYKSFVDKLKENSPRILVVGDTGTGKSSLINIVFGFSTGKGAAVRAGGEPVTQEFEQYGPTDCAPVRIIDSKGIEKLSATEQMDDIRVFINKETEDDPLNAIHLAYYFADERFQRADVTIIEELQKLCGVIVILNKCDKRTKDSIRNTENAIRDHFPSIDIIKCGDPRGTRNWIPETCTNDKCPDKEFIPEVNFHRKTWNCTAVVDTYEDPETMVVCNVYCPGHGDDQPFGHKELVHRSFELLPELCQRSFMAAQRVDLARKHTWAAGIIVTSTVTACGIGATPIPFSDIGPLLLLEGGMAASLMAVYGVTVGPLNVSDVVKVSSGGVGIAAALGYGTAQVLKLIPGFNVAGAAIDMAIAGTTVCVLGIGLSAALAHVLSFQDREQSSQIDIKHLVEVASKTVNVGNLIQSIMSGTGGSTEAQVSSLIAARTQDLQTLSENEIVPVVHSSN